MTDDETNKEQDQPTQENPDLEEQPKEELIETIQNLRDDYQTLEDRHLRLQAEFQNYKNRTQKEKENLKKQASKDLIQAFLPILDNFELALKNQNGQNFKDGMEMIFSQIKQTLEDKGLTKIDTDQTFDPTKHEAVLTDENAPHNTIVEELQPGYKLGDQIIRHAKVKIGKNKQETNE